MLSDQEAHKPERKRRKDAGQPRYENRDYYALDWIGQQGIIRFDQLQQLLGRESPEQDTWDLILSPSATRNAITRWEIKHLINAAYLLPKEPKYYWLSTMGFQSIELKLPHYAPKHFDLPFLFACNQVRLHLEQLNRIDEQEFGEYGACSWESRREIQARTPGHENRLLPSAIFETETRGSLAIEVIIANSATIETAMKSYLTNDLGYREIWYFADATHLPLLEKTREKLRRSGDASKLYLYNADTILLPRPRPKRHKKTS